jgi:hypothetical protein
VLSIPYTGLVASFHSYACDAPLISGECDVDGSLNHQYQSACASTTCLTSEIGPSPATSVGAHHPVVIGEFGDYACDQSYPTTLMSWADPAHISYLAWAWNPGWDCATGPSLVTSLGGTPTTYGAAVKSHLQSL